MFELKFANYHRAASLSSQASSLDVCSIGWRIIDQSLFKHWVNNGRQRLSLSSCTPTIFLLQQSWVVSCVSLLSDLCAWVKVKIASQWSRRVLYSDGIWTTLWDFKGVKNPLTGGLFSAVLSKKHCEKVYWLYNIWFSRVCNWLNNWMHHTD